MFSKKLIWGSLASLGMLFGIAQGVQSAETSSGKANQFRQIEQPLAVKIGVTAGGSALIGLELWWFLLSKKISQKVPTKQGTQEVTITVDGGYDPARVVVKTGQPVRLNFLRRDPNSCLERVLLPDFYIAADLTLDQVTPVEFTPQQPGEYQFSCGMNMFRGVVAVEK
ncbi:MAG: hypothetical protein BRC51_09095 [Cyanobacteria bacterium SW_12_48_29]|jgi:plastocyanin domain-containing protein|nr:MAG: hypothetical protein BRC45_06365 [Cyanobacteria bacterium QS_5_48_63]PSO88651.1 MAG: hypothetical protein BRC43_06370 [Cyanobacteria bacterium QS_3_48_167]PSP03816.1 MAG: hypothetical protein BRC51_09095 [Cyanobacteria bacterium SW_12_48_29]